MQMVGRSLTVPGVWQAEASSAVGALWNDSDSVVHDNNYPTLDYTVVMKRLTSSDDPNRIIIYGIPAPLSSNSLWYQGLIFEYANNQKFRIYKTIAGVDTVLVDWTTSLFIKPYDYNKMRVISKNGVQKYYINDNLVAAGNESTLTTGQVGVGFTQSVASTPLYVDFARVLTTVNNLSLGSLPEGVATYPLVTTIAIEQSSIDQSE
jgi:hypothetical protein